MKGVFENSLDYSKPEVLEQVKDIAEAEKLIELYIGKKFNFSRRGK